MSNRPIQENQLENIFFKKEGGDSIVDSNLSGNSLNILKTNTSSNGDLIHLTNSGTGFDIYGTNGNFTVDKFGNVTANNLNVASFTISNFSVSSLLTTQDLMVNGNANIVGNLTVSDNLNVSNQLIVSDLGTFETDLTVKDNLYVDNLFVSGSSDFVNANFNSATVSGSLTINPGANLLVSGGLNVNLLTATAFNVASGFATSLTATNGNFNNVNVSDNISIETSTSGTSFLFDTFDNISQASGGNPILYVAGSGAPFTLGYYNGLTNISLGSINSVRFDAVVPDDYPTPASALNAGIYKIFVRNGSYDDSATSLTVTNSSRIVGESKTGVTWQFADLTVNADRIEIEDLTIGAGADNSSVDLNVTNGHLKRILFNIDAVTVTEKLDVQAGSVYLEDVSEFGSNNSRTFIKYSGSNTRLKKIKGLGSSTNFPSDYQFEILGQNLVLDQVEGSANNLLIVSGGSSIWIKNSQLEAINNDTALTLKDANNVYVMDSIVNVEADSINSSAIKIENSKNIYIKNIVAEQTTAATPAARVFIEILEDSTDQIINLHLSDIKLKFYDHLISFDSHSNFVNYQGFYINNILAQNHLDSLIESPTGNHYISECHLDKISVNYEDVTSSFIKLNSSGNNSTRLNNNWTITNCNVVYFASSNADVLDFNFTANPGSLGIKNLNISNLNITNNGRVLNLDGLGSNLTFKGINFNSNSTQEAFYINSEQGDVTNVIFSDINVDNAGHFLRVEANGSGDIRRVLLSNFNFKTTFSSALSTGNGHFTMVSNSSREAEFIVVTSGTVESTALSGNIFEHSGANTKGHVHGIMWEDNGGSLNIGSTNWDTSNNNYPV